MARIQDMQILAAPMICSLLALSQVFAFTAPAMAQGYPNYIPSPGTGGYYNGTGGVYVPRLPIVPQYGYGGSTRSYPGNGLGVGVGLGMFGAMAGVGTVMMASQIMARRNLNKIKNPSNTPKDKADKKDRRQQQELKLKGELDSDYQKELAEKGLVPQAGQLPGAASPGFPPPSTGAQPFGGSMSSAMTPPPAAPSMGAAPSIPAAIGQPAATPGPAEGVLNTPWSPMADPGQPSF